MLKRIMLYHAAIHISVPSLSLSPTPLSFSISLSLLRYLPFSAMTFEAGFMIAESAVMGLRDRIGLAESVRSMIITWDVSPTFSRTQMNLSDSIVRVAKLICCTLMPTFWSCICVCDCVSICIGVKIMSP